MPKLQVGRPRPRCDSRLPPVLQTRTCRNTTRIQADSSVQAFNHHHRHSDPQPENPWGRPPDKQALSHGYWRHSGKQTPLPFGDLKFLKLSVLLLKVLPLGLAASASPGGLLEMQRLGPHPGLIELESVSPR